MTPPRKFENYEFDGTPGIILLESLVSRVSALEEANKDILPSIGKVDAIFDSMQNLGKAVGQIAEDVKDLAVGQKNIEGRLDSTAKGLKAIEDSKKESDTDNKNSKNRWKTAFLTIAASVISAAIVYLLKLR